jgi:hypothetical protein
MRTCIRCKEKNIFDNRRICLGCMKEWTTMRTTAFDTLESKYGKMNPENHPIFIKEMKRLEKIWKMDKDLFQLELDKI